MGRFGSSVEPTDNSLHCEKPTIPTTDPQMSLHYFGRRHREKYGITPESYMEMDLNALLIKDKVSSYLYPAEDDSLEFIQKDCVLIVDRSLKPRCGNIVIAGFNGETLLRRFVELYDSNKRCRLPALVTDFEAEPPFLCTLNMPKSTSKALCVALSLFSYSHDHSSSITCCPTNDSLSRCQFVLRIL